MVLFPLRMHGLSVDSGLRSEAFVGTDCFIGLPLSPVTDGACLHTT